MDIESLLLNLGDIVDNVIKTGESIENWYDGHERRKAQRRDERLARYTNAELRYFNKDYQIHPERYEIVSKASIKAARKRSKKC